MAPSPSSYCMLSRVVNFLNTLSEYRIVSKPQVLSRLRRVTIVDKPDETIEERLYRDRHESIQCWNDSYWAEHNELFKRSKADYIKSNFGNIDSEEALSHDQLSGFYRDFLERNREKHLQYNWNLYRNHLDLLSLSIKAKASRLKLLTKYGG